MLKQDTFGGRIKKIYDQPKTPYQRLIDSEGISKTAKKKLAEDHQKMNPILLSQELDAAMKIFKEEIRKHQAGGNNAVA